MSFCGLACVILGRIREARDEAFVDVVPLGEYSERMVVPWATHAL